MGLIMQAGALVMKLGQLVSSCGCCVAYWCTPTRQDACGQGHYECTKPTSVPADSLGPYGGDCDGGCPDPTCEKYWCYATGYTPCGGVVSRCSVDAYGDDADAGPFDEPVCDGCGSGTPEPCPGDKHFCCWPTPATGEPVNKDGDSTCQLGPCTGMLTGDNSLYRSGPHNTTQECAAQCEKYACDGSGCSNSADGTYRTLEACQLACGCGTPSSETCGITPISLVRGSSPRGFHSRQYSVSPERLTVKLTYDAYSYPDRFQIWGPSTDGNGAVVATRLIKGDSNYRGVEPLPDGCSGFSVVGAGAGSVTWEKKRGITCFEICVISPCDGSAWEYDLTCEGNQAP